MILWAHIISDTGFEIKAVKWIRLGRPSQTDQRFMCVKYTRGVTAILNYLNHLKFEIVSFLKGFWGKAELYLTNASRVKPR